MDIHDILQDTKDEFREEQFGLYLQPIQHHKVETIGWIMFLHEEVDLQFWQEFFNEQLRTKGHEGDMAGLSIRKPLDGTKQKTQNNHKQTKAIHVETIGDHSDRVKLDIKTILKGTATKAVYHSELRLIPQYDYRQQTSHYNDKVKSCIMSNDQYMAQITMGDLDIENVSRMIACQGNATIRELILRIEHSSGSPLFIGVERRG